MGILTATALVATMGEANHFKSGREFAAFVGLVIVAMANKMARMAWTILAHDREYQKGYVSQVLI